VISHQLSVISAIVLAAVSVCAGEIDEFKVKREQVFEFAKKPVVTRDGDKVTIAFTSKAYCDATVAIEDADRKIVRHLASGVLGKNAPAPFKKNSKTQTLVWDGKDDEGKYVDDKDNITVRVSLGLKPQFERTLFWSPHKRVTSWGSSLAPLMAATPEGVYVYDRAVFDHVRLYDHKGDYVRTVYPFPRDKVGRAVGIRRHTFPHDGQTLPLKAGFYQSTLLHGEKLPLRVQRSTTGLAATGMAVRGARLALIGNKLTRLATDGTTGGLAIGGPELWKPVRLRGMNADLKNRYRTLPSSAALSPDGKWLYAGGYTWRHTWHWDALHGVMRVPFEGGKPELFAGKSMKQGAGQSGTKNGEFRVAAGLACDAKGRVYVCDFINNRIQVFAPDGTHLKNIASFRPAQIRIHPKTGELYVFSWVIYNRFNYKPFVKIKPTLRVHGPFDNPKERAAYPLPLPEYKRPNSEWGWTARTTGSVYIGIVDFYAKTPTVWLSQIWPSRGRTGIRLYRINGKKLEQVRNFKADTIRAVKRDRPPILNRQRLYVNPKTGMLWVGESDAGVGKSFKQVVKIDPDTGKISLVDLPFDCEDLTFDTHGRLYMRTGKHVMRYSPETWREIPWDYGEQQKRIGFSSSRGGRSSSAVAALRTPGHRSHSFWHLGGMSVSPTGHLAVATCNGANPGVRASANRAKKDFRYAGAKYVPTLYPGRPRWGEIHVWDPRGKPVYKDILPGMGHMDGIGLDRHDNIYVMSSSSRIIGGKPYDPKLTDDLSETIIKARPHAARILSAGRRVPVPITPELRPKRSMDIKGSTTGPAWVEGAEWLYGGVGFAGKNAAWAGGGCCCWNSRFNIDYFARSFAPELRHFSVAVLDSSGNLIMRIGQYGNVDDGRPCGTPWQNARKRSTGLLSGEPPNQRSIGGDEVAVFHGAYVGVHTDRRLFIADPGNARIMSVKLGYHATESVSLKDIRDRKQLPVTGDQ
jgi:NHL repeat-containing protein